MITSYLAGGLGNQMFQYAAAKALALRLGVELVIDLRFFMEAGEPAKAYRLHEFSITDRVIDYADGKRRSPHGLLARSIRFLSGQSRRTYREARLGHNAEVNKLPDGSILIGNFQSPLFFEDKRQEILRAFDRRVPRQNLTENTIHLHVRRGDYLNHAGFALADPLAYYGRALQSARAEFPQATLRVFSDDISWCREQPIFDGAEFVGPKPGVSPLVDLKQMCECSVLVIANSSYSWWAGYLASSRFGRIYCPETWISGLDATSLNIYPPTWTVVSCT